MPLTHVCMWSGHGWKMVTASEAAKKFPYGTSARSGLFMCNICGQYVTLTSGNIRDPYFKHSSEEKSKDCPQRTFVNYANISFNAQSHTLPIRIRLVSKDRFELEMGFVSLPSSLIGKKDARKIVIQGSQNSLKVQYSLERLYSIGITYLSVGNTPCEVYHISYPIEAQKVQSYWPSEVPGISKEGTLFDKKSGKKLPEDADVSVGRTYYVVTKSRRIHHYNYINSKTICRSQSGYFDTWYVHEVTATKYDEDSAKFFLEYHARLTDHPVEFYPIWPEFIESPYKVLHRDDELYFYLEGEGVTSKAFPHAAIKEVGASDDGSHILHISCNDRQQLVSAGRAKVLKYTYLWKDSLIRSQKKQEVAVLDDEGNILKDGNHQVLPHGNRIYISSAAVDGFVEVTDLDGFSVEKYRLTAGQKIELEHVVFGLIVNVYCGLDLVWKSKYEKPSDITKEDDRELIKMLKSYQNDYIKIPHAAGGFAIQICGRPVLKDWFYHQIKSGHISKTALKILVREGKRI